MRIANTTYKQKYKIIGNKILLIPITDIGPKIEAYIKKRMLDPKNQ